MLTSPGFFFEEANLFILDVLRNKFLQLVLVVVSLDSAS